MAAAIPALVAICDILTFLQLSYCKNANAPNDNANVPAIIIRYMGIITSHDWMFNINIVDASVKQRNGRNKLNRPHANVIPHNTGDAIF
jgi:hypothetical protein